MYGIYANIWGILMVNVTIYGIHTDPMGMKMMVQRLIGFIGFNWRRAHSVHPPYRARLRNAADQEQRGGVTMGYPLSNHEITMKHCKFM